MWRSVINAKDLHQTFTNREESLILYLVGTDYFTKWVKVEPLTNIRDVDANKFVWKNIVARFGVPQTLISDNGLQFDSKSFKRYCYD